MNRPSDDEYGSLSDLFGGPDPDDHADSFDDDIPAGLPPEYAEAYRRGYERARRGEEPTVALEQELAAALASRPVEPAFFEPGVVEPGFEPDSADLGSHEPTRAIPVGSVTPPRPSYAEEAEPDREGRRRPPVAMVALAALAVLMVLAAFGIGRLFADDAAQDETAASESTGETGESGGPERQQERYTGPVRAVTIAGASATCQTGNSVDAGGNPTSYEPAKAIDSDISTAWRCDGSGQGQRFTVQLPDEITVAEVGLVPGYAKTDPASGVDRYAENNRITKVRWRFDDGTTVVQRINGDPGNRGMRTIRVPEAATRSVVIEILASQAGPRNTVAISEIRVATPAG